MAASSQASLVHTQEYCEQPSGLELEPLQDTAGSVNSRGVAQKLILDAPKEEVSLPCTVATVILTEQVLIGVNER